MSVSEILLDFNTDENTIIAALLHDVTEDCAIDPIEIEKKFGKTVFDLVEGMKKLSHV